jgi:hypothetical protein
MIGDIHLLSLGLPAVTTAALPWAVGRTDGRGATVSKIEGRTLVAAKEQD